MNFWCKVFGWTEEEWKEIVRIYGIRFRYKGHRYIILPGSWLWILIYAGGMAIAIGGFWAFCVLTIILFG